MKFVPDYMNISNAAKNKKAKRLPLYEHSISVTHMEKILNKNFADLINGDYKDKLEFFKWYCEFFKTMGYDTVSFEVAIRAVFPNGGALDQHITPAIATREDLLNYPWEEIPQLFYESSDESFRALKESLPSGMKMIGGPGYGIFECVQDLTGYMNLCVISYENHELYKDLFLNMRKLFVSIWKNFLQRHSDMCAVARMGDDLGFKSNTLLSAEDIKEHIVPAYADIVSIAHNHNLPFLLHSCGNIFNVMEEIISVAKIDAKHSNEDQIALFPVWVEKYGDRIGNFGGVDADVLCRMDKVQLKEYISDILSKVGSEKGIAFGTGNSVPDYVPTENYINMIEIVREYRKG